MKVTRELVDSVAHLARLDLDAAEREAALRDLTRILDYVDALSALDTDGVQPMSHALRLQNVLRADESAPSMAAQDVLQNAPERKDGCFLAPRAVE